MKFAVAVLCVAVATANAALTTIYPAATTYLRTPHLDSAIITSDRVGANFAYSTVEGHAYEAVSPIFRSAYPVAFSPYSALPFAYTGLHPYVAPAAAPLPIISPFAPLPTLQIAGAEEAGKIENAESTTAAAAAAPAAPAESQPEQSGEIKADKDSVSVESA